jgi:hypothetical protein
MSSADAPPKDEDSLAAHELTVFEYVEVHRKALQVQ